ncbi:hypothetical protein LJC15_04475 [Desulfovibrio sp. OttesenSCG-928-G11]|nr:hypothetical protein [Desulfovibrio sp. OttesenSCG-928-G11]
MADALKVMYCLLVCAICYIMAQRLAMRYALQKELYGPHKPPLLGDAIAGVVGLQIGCLFLSLTARPIMSCILSASFAGLLMILSRMKENALREPAVLADVWLLPQIIKYPEMYFPYMPVRSLVIGGGVSAGFSCCAEQGRVWY